MVILRSQNKITDFFDDFSVGMSFQSFQRGDRLYTSESDPVELKYL